MLLVLETASKTRQQGQDELGRMGAGTGLLPGVRRENLGGYEQRTDIFLLAVIKDPSCFCVDTELGSGDEGRNRVTGEKSFGNLVQ